MVSSHDCTFGSLLKSFRRAAELTQDELAQRTGYNLDYISMLERGVRPASPATVRLLADALSLTKADRAELQRTAAASAEVRSPSHFGILLRQYRIAAGMTQEELARCIQVSARTIGDLERIPTSSPKKAMLDRLSQALGLTVEERRALEVSVPRRGDRHPVRALPRSSLPVEPTPLLGREREVDAALRLLHREGVRLLTLTGPGGVGKSRLALRVAALVERDFADGVVIVPLAAIRDPTLVFSEIAHSIGLGEEGDRLLGHVVADALQDRELLLLLDNFEHLLIAAPLISELLALCPQLKLLVTSRAALRLRGEYELDVPPLALPDPRHDPSPQMLGDSPAVALFVQCARASQPLFRLTAENAGAIAAICRRLDGLPLAIELAAARLRVLSPNDLIGRLEHGLHVLADGPRDLPARQQTMIDTIAWSYNLLRSGEQNLFRQLSIFAGSFTLEGAESICGGQGIDVLKGVTALVEQSLLRRQGKEDEPRFVLLETVREYTAEQLERHGQANTVRERHAAYYLQLCEAAASESPRGAGPESLARLEVEHDNLRAALSWFRATGQGQPLLRMSLALAGFWERYSYFREGLHWLEEALALQSDMPSALRARALSLACWLATMSGQPDRAIELGKKSLQLRRNLGESRAIVGSLLTLALAAIQQGDYATAHCLLDESMERCHELGHRQGVIETLHLLGELALNEGAPDKAVALADQSVALSRVEGTSRFLIHSLDNLARALLCQGDLFRALPHWTEGLQLARAGNDRRGIAYYLEGFAAAAAHEGRSDRAGRLAGAAHTLRQEIHSPLSPSEAVILNRFLAPAGQSAEGPIWKQAWEEGCAMTLEQAVNYALCRSPSTDP